MKKINEFYNAVISDEKLRDRYNEIVGSSALEELSREQIDKLGLIAEEIGAEISEEDFRNYVSGGELDDDDLDAVAGGKGETVYKDVTLYVCDIGGQAGVDDNNFGENAEPVIHT